MEQRQICPNRQLYHETQTSQPASGRTALLSQAASIEDRFLLGLAPADGTPLSKLLTTLQPMLTLSGNMYHLLFPCQLTTSLTQSLSLYDRLSCALTVAQVGSVQRLCNHYAARLAPLTCHDPSRESNHRLTQLTEFSRQLASQPGLIDRRVLQRLEAVGLSHADIVTLSQICGFISYQTRVVAGLQALMSIPVHRIPGLLVPTDADSRMLCHRDWQPWLPPLPSPVSDSQREALNACQTLPFPASALQLLASEASLLSAWGQLMQQLNYCTAETDIATLAAAVSARINGCALGFHQMPTGKLRDALVQSVDQALTVAGKSERAIMVFAAQLIRSPSQLTINHIHLLTECGFSQQHILHLILSIAAAGWNNRLMQSLGETSCLECS